MERLSDKKTIAEKFGDKNVDNYLRLIDDG